MKLSNSAFLLSWFTMSSTFITSISASKDHQELPERKDHDHEKAKKNYYHPTEVKVSTNKPCYKFGEPITTRFLNGNDDDIPPENMIRDASNEWIAIYNTASFPQDFDNSQQNLAPAERNKKEYVPQDYVDSAQSVQSVSSAVLSVQENQHKQVEQQIANVEVSLDQDPTLWHWLCDHQNSHSINHHDPSSGGHHNQEAPKEGGNEQECVAPAWGEAKFGNRKLKSDFWPLAPGAYRTVLAYGHHPAPYTAYAVSSVFVVMREGDQCHSSGASFTYVDYYNKKDGEIEDRHVQDPSPGLRGAQ